MKKEIQALVDTAVKGIQAKKGRGIKVIDLEGMDGVVTQAFVVCEGGSPSQVSAIADAVEETMRKDLKEKTVKTAGTENCIWVAMDYIDIIVHIFLPDARDFYNLETLWSDAKTTDIPDVD